MSGFPGKQALPDFNQLSKLKLPGLPVLFFLRVTSWKVIATEVILALVKLREVPLFPDGP